MTVSPPSTKPRQKTSATAAHEGQTLDLDRYVPAFITFIANKLSNSATAFYQRNFGVNVTEWRIMSLLAIEPGIQASRICHVIGLAGRPIGMLGTAQAMMAERGSRHLDVVQDNGKIRRFFSEVAGCGAW